MANKGDPWSENQRKAFQSEVNKQILKGDAPIFHQISRAAGLGTENMKKYIHGVGSENAKQLLEWVNSEEAVANLRGEDLE